MHTNKNRFNSLVLSIALALILPISAAAQNASLKGTATAAAKSGAAVSVSIQDYKLSSKLMAREMPYRVVLPANYAANNQARYPVIYLLHGLTGHYDNWGDKTKIAEYLAPYQMIVVMPEGNNGWYTDSATVPNDRYESYITRELIPEIDKKFRTRSDRGHRIVAGLSMGGYGSIKFGLKNPEMFGLVGSFSGALGAASWTEKVLGNRGSIAQTILSVYGAEDSPTRRDNDIFKIARESSAERIKNLPFIYLDCGTEDFLIQNNRDFATLLLEKKIPHEFRQLPGAHTWNYWERQIQEFLRIGDSFFKTQNKLSRTMNSVKSGEIILERRITREMVERLPVKRASRSVAPAF
jgi:S-formylglutathione hydrolase FrmB